jgi:hypothetical protein
VDGATVRVSNALTQGGAGVVRTDGGTIALRSLTVVGGGVEAAADGLIRVEANTALEDVRTAGPIFVENARTLSVRGDGLENNGVITINETAGGSGTYLQAESAVTLSGTGSVILNASSNPDTGVLRSSGGGASIINGVGHTVGGRGRILPPFTNAGTIAPGAPDGGTARLEVRGAWDMQETSTLAFDLAGTEQGVTYDHLATNSAVALDGAFRASFANSYVPPPQTNFEVITATSVTGTFDSVVLPELPMDRGIARLQYTPTAVRVRIPLCPADWNAMDGVNSQDFFDFLNAFFVGC